MNTRATTLISALGLAWGAAVWAQDQDDFVSPLVEFFEAGVICAQDTGEVRIAPDTVSGTTHVLNEAPPFVSTDRVVPAVLGIGFGVTSGLASDRFLEDVTMTITHPPFEGTGATEQSFQTVLRPVYDPGLTFYQFDYAYELALGDWTMTASSNGKTLYESTFTVVHPTALPELAGVCGYQDLIG